ncbi:hypothetical protein HAX54_008877, partial [Datura stramonium]|nr:hypothetical protein [Datura stramonium]
LGGGGCHAPSERGILRRTIAGGWIRRLIQWLHKGYGVGTSASLSMSRQADSVKCGDLVAVLGIDGEEGTWPTLHKPEARRCMGLRSVSQVRARDRDVTPLANGERLCPLECPGRPTRLNMGSLSLFLELTVKRGLGQPYTNLVGDWSRSPEEPMAG